MTAAEQGKFETLNTIPNIESREIRAEGLLFPPVPDGMIQYFAPVYFSDLGRHTYRSTTQDVFKREGWSYSRQYGQSSEYATVNISVAIGKSDADALDYAATQQTWEEHLKLRTRGEEPIYIIAGAIQRRDFRDLLSDWSTSNTRIPVEFNRVLRLQRVEPTESNWRGVGVFVDVTEEFRQLADR